MCIDCEGTTFHHCSKGLTSMVIRCSFPWRSCRLFVSSILAPAKATLKSNVQLAYALDKKKFQKEILAMNELSRVSFANSRLKLVAWLVQQSKNWICSECHVGLIHLHRPLKQAWLEYSEMLFHCWPCKWFPRTYEPYEVSILDHQRLWLSELGQNGKAWVLY